MCTGRSGCAVASFSTSLSSKGAYTLSQRPRPRRAVEVTLAWSTTRVGFVARPDVTSAGREARKALRQLMVRGMPLKEMHLRPTSRMISAVSTLDEEAEATPWRRERDSGELRVKVAADCTLC